MNWLRDLPIQRKLTLVILLTCSVVLFLACGMLGVYQIFDSRKAVVRDTTVLADILAKNTQAALTFQDESAAQQILLALQAKHSVIAACLYDEKGKPFAHYTREDTGIKYPPQPAADGYHFEQDHLVVFRPVFFER